MKKIKTLFVREFEKGKVTIKNEVNQGCEWVFDKEVNVVPSVKWDGSCCAYIDGELYKRFDYKAGRKLPENAIPCQDKADEITGHFPYWVKCDINNPADKWFIVAEEAFKKYFKGFNKHDMTLEAVGKHFNGNRYDFDIDVLIPHGIVIIKNEKLDSFDSIKNFLENNFIEGIVFYKYEDHKVVDMCKIKRSDFNIKW